MKVGLKEELDKKREKSRDNSENVVEEVKLLMDSESSAEKEALRIAGLDHHVQHVESAKGVEIERKQLEEQYGDKVFTTEEIKEICLKYDLRLLPARRFKGKLDTEIASKLKHFVAAHPEIGNYSDSFYIIAPSNAFDLEGRPAKPFVTIDPILLYQTRENQYAFIHKWGEDFTIFRKLRGMFFKSKVSMWSICMSAWIVTLSAIMGWAFGGFTGEWFQYLNLLWITPVSFFLGWATLAIMFNDGESFNSRATDETWDSEYSRNR